MSSSCTWQINNAPAALIRVSQTALGSPNESMIARGFGSKRDVEQFRPLRQAPGDEADAEWRGACLSLAVSCSSHALSAVAATQNAEPAGVRSRRPRDARRRYHVHRRQQDRVPDAQRPLINGVLIGIVSSGILDSHRSRDYHSLKNEYLMNATISKMKRSHTVELSDLLTFSTVARLGGITRAADELNTVQSNVTQRVKALEAEIGTALFERHSRGMTLTGAGRRLLPYAQRMTALSREAVLAARDDGEPKGPLSIGSMETTAAVRLPVLLAEFHRRFPAVRLSLRTATTADLVAAVLEGTLDGAFVAGPIEHAELSSTVAFKEELVLVTARRWTSLAALRAGTPESGPDRAGVSHRLHLSPTARAGVYRIRLAVRVAVRTRHARRHDRLRRRRHGRDAVAASGRGAGPSAPGDQHPHARRVTIASRYALHPAPQRASIQCAARFCLLPGQTRSIHRRLMRGAISAPRK